MKLSTKRSAYLGPIAVALTLGTLATACTSRSDTGAQLRTDSAQTGRPGTLEGATRRDSSRIAGGGSGMSGMTGTAMKGMGNAGMAGPAGSMGSMMARMQAHMRVMDGPGGDSLKGMLPMHRQMLVNMLAEMSAQMRNMNMTGDKQWIALSDSIRQDLVQMRTLSVRDLGQFMPAHGSRVMRLMNMHQSMMQGTKE